ncbi:MAG: 1-(5-phosphoribosyl)-5-[(5-phosphoribosylamino)methylideneamino]imidazole-4-carboxamide isomerase [Gemmataceae bacterium]
MQIYPAIDIRGGQCVRLRQGDYAQETVFAADPAEMARRWVEEGATYLHLVDLDGARAGQPVNSESVRRIVAAAGVPCQLGGGLRSEEHIAQALQLGVARVIIGTRALQDPDWLAALTERHPGQIVLGIDARAGKVATAGWLEVSETSALELVERTRQAALAAVVYTDIGRDGMMAGPNFEGLRAMAAACPAPVIASGGVTTVDDVKQLAQLQLPGCIIGRALYEGTIQLPEALALARKPD